MLCLVEEREPLLLRPVHDDEQVDCRGGVLQHLLPASGERYTNGIRRYIPSGNYSVYFYSPRFFRSRDAIVITEHLFPRIPYDEVESTFVREEIRAGAFGDIEHREYVNDLVYVEWYARGGLSPNATGLSAACASFKNWRTAAKYPQAYDAVREDCGAETRAEYTWSRSGVDDPDARRRWARRHRAEWRAVRGESTEPGDAVDRETPLSERPRFSMFRFPRMPYDEVESTFVREEIRRGSFDDVDYRRYVNALVYFEGWTREPGKVRSGGAYPSVRPWIVAAQHPEAYDLVRADLGASTRADMTPHSSFAYGDDLEERAARHEREWRAVAESEQ